MGGAVTPDTYEMAADGAISCTIGRKHTRIDLNHEDGVVVTGDVTVSQQEDRVMEDAMVAALAGLGSRIAEILDGPQDIEWAVADRTAWILQARPITAPVPAIGTPEPPEQPGVLSGTPGSHGTITATARVVQSSSDFSTVQAGEIVICPYTDPAWTPLFTIAVGVVTETGGTLSHAAIVAREYGLPAVLGVTEATTLIESGARITLDGTAGTITLL